MKKIPTQIINKGKNLKRKRKIKRIDYFFLTNCILLSFEEIIFRKLKMKE